MNPKSDAIYAMVRDFRQRGVPIDGVGFQMHIANLHADVASISANIKRFTAWECRSTSPRWMSPCRSTQMAMLVPRTCNSRRTSIARLPPLSCLIPGARRSRPGVSRTSIPGSDRTRRRRKARRCRLIGTIGPSLPTRRCGVRWSREGVVSRWSLVVGRRAPCFPRDATNRERPTTNDQRRPIM